MSLAIAEVMARLAAHPSGFDELNKNIDFRGPIKEVKEHLDSALRVRRLSMIAISPSKGPRSIITSCPALRLLQAQTVPSGAAWSIRNETAESSIVAGAPEFSNRFTLGHQVTTSGSFEDKSVDLWGHLY